jgi:predicted transcriptional regulator
MTTHKVIVGNKKQVQKLTLPDDVVASLKKVHGVERKAYVNALRKEGWTCESIGKALGLTRQAVDLYKTYNCPDEVAEKIKDLPIPELPASPIYRTRRVEVEPDVLAKLKELHAKACLVRSSSKKYRAEAEQFTKLAWEQKRKGISVYSLAKSLGITHSALNFRFVRYGYSESKGKSHAYRKLTHREITHE